MLSCTLNAQSNTVALYEDYIKQYKDRAVAEMQEYKIPASITLAQGLLESAAGRSLLATEANNHFGIKCKETWVGETYTYDDDIEGECFRKYKSAGESYRDHSLFLTTRSRYGNLFKLSINDYKGWAIGLKKAGYATNPKYAEQLIKVIEDYRLFLYDDPNYLSKDNVARAQQKTTEDKPKTKNEEKTETKPLIVAKKKEETQQIEALDASNYKYSYTSSLGRKVYMNEDVPFIFAQTGDTWSELAKEFDVFAFQMYTQNDLDKDSNIEAGQIIYLEPKNKKSKEETYITKGGETLYYISQLKAIKLKSLIKCNKNTTEPPHNPLEAGLVINLK